MRLRFQRLLEANGLSDLPHGLQRGLDLCSLRAEGASWMLLVSEDAELTRRRGRWLTSRIMMEIYVQEVTSLQFLPKLPPEKKAHVLAGASNFPWVLCMAERLSQAKVPMNIWYVIYKSEAAMSNTWDEHGGKEACETIMAKRTDLAL